jgi:hypothetical protein
VRFTIKKADLYGDSTNIMHKMRNLLPFKNILRYFLFNIYDGIYFELVKV